MVTLAVGLGIVTAGIVLWGWAYLLDRWGDKGSAERTTPTEPTE